jgi:hypothetical protein
VEFEAERRFSSFRERLGIINAPGQLIDLAAKASQDERRHAAHCVRLTQAYGVEVPIDEASVNRIAPESFSDRQALTYEIVAACCISETESMAVLLQLQKDAIPHIREVVHELARDEVDHARLGWAFLAFESALNGVGYLSSYIPAMLAGNAGADILNPDSPECDPEELIRHGVLSNSSKQRVFVQAVTEVILPGLEHFGIDARAGRTWLEETFSACGEFSQVSAH